MYLLFDADGRYVHYVHSLLSTKVTMDLLRAGNSFDVTREVKFVMFKARGRESFNFQKFPANIRFRQYTIPHNII